MYYLWFVIFSCQTELYVFTLWFDSYLVNQFRIVCIIYWFVII